MVLLMFMKVMKIMSTITDVDKVKFSNEKFKGDLIKDTEQYVLHDNKTLKNLVVSKTVLNRGQSTNGHTHNGQEEVYQFIRGYGTMTLNSDSFVVYPGDIVLIEDGVFHRVHGSSGCETLEFVCVFVGKRKHK